MARPAEVEADSWAVQSRPRWGPMSEGADTAPPAERGLLAALLAANLRVDIPHGAEPVLGQQTLCALGGRQWKVPAHAGTRTKLSVGC